MRVLAVGSVRDLEQVAHATKLARVLAETMFSAFATKLAALVACVLRLTWPNMGGPVLAGREWNSRVSLLAMFGPVCCACCWGATKQTLRAPRDCHSVKPRAMLLDTGLGVAAGVVTATLYRLAQVAIEGELKPNIEADSFMREPLIVSAASLIVALYLVAALARFDKVKGSVFSGRYSDAVPK